MYIERTAALVLVGLVASIFSSSRSVTFTVVFQDFTFLIITNRNASFGEVDLDPLQPTNKLNTQALLINLIMLHSAARATVYPVFHSSVAAARSLGKNSVWPRKKLKVS